MPYQFTSRVRYSEVGEDNRLSILGLIDYLQDSNMFHMEDLGAGIAWTLAKGKTWIIVSWQIVINSLPKMGDEITMQTWPYRLKGFYGDRNYRLLDKEGRVLAYASAIWVYIDINTGRPARVDEKIRELYPSEDIPLPMGPISRKIPMPEGGVEKESFSVMRSHLDTNHHVNNGQYILMAEDYLPEGFVTRQIRVEYRKAAVLHDVIVPMVYTDPGKCTVSLCAEDKQPYAIIEFSEN